MRAKPSEVYDVCEVLSRLIVISGTRATYIVREATVITRIAMMSGYGPNQMPVRSARPEPFCAYNQHQSGVR